MSLTKGNMTMGRKYTDDATGFVGTLVGIGTFLDSGDQAMLQAQASEPNKVPETAWFGVGRLSFYDEPAK